MNKQETYDYLTAHGIAYEATEHRAVFSMEELDSVDLSYPRDDAKNIFVVDDKKRNHYLITMRGNKRINLREFRHAHGTRPLHFVPEDDLMAILGLTAGSVTPLGLLSDAERRVQFFLDEDFFADEGRIGVHPNDNTATVWLQANDLIALIEEHGNPVTVCVV